MSGGSSQRPAGPLALAVSAPAGLRAVYWLGALAVCQAIALILFAEGLARGLIGLQDGRPVTAALLLAVGGALLRTLVSWLIARVAARAAVGVKESLRGRLAERVVDGGGELPLSEGKLAVAATRSLDDIDDYFTAVLPAILMSAAVPALLILRFLFADWVSALIVVLCLPLVPVFMILIGKYTEERVGDAQDALDRLSNSLVELVQGLPVLIGLGRARAQRQTLARLAEEYRNTTMTTLRVAFLSALALELISTISVAVVAVFIGVRLIHGTLDLQTGLVILILAPECFAPLRQLGAAFHASENGMAAHERLRAIVSGPRPRPLEQDPSHDGIGVEGLRILFTGRAEPAVGGLSFRAARGEHIVLTGESGSGKSSTLAALSGLLRGDDRVTLSGRSYGIAAERIALLPQTPRFGADTPLEEIALHAPEGFPAESAERLLAGLGLAATSDLPIAALSPGEQRRLGLARVLARIEDGADIVLLDEPTAHLDAGAAGHVLELIERLPAHVTAISATHDARVIALADRAVPLAASGLVQRVPEPPARSEEREPERPALPAEATGHPEERRLPLRQLLGELVGTLQPWRPRFLLALLFGVGAAIAGVALTAVSAWLIVRASYQPPIMMLLVAIVGVRFFGLARAVLRYCERLWLHDAVLQALTDLRLRVWDRFLALGPSHRELLRGPAALKSLIADVDDVRDLAPRAVFPPVIALVVILTGGLALGSIAASAGWLLVLSALVAVAGGSGLVLIADSRAGVRMQQARTRLLRSWAALLGARTDIVGNGIAGRALERMRAVDREAGREALRGAQAAGLGQAWTVLVCLLASTGMVWLLGPLLSTGELSLELLTVCALVPMALIDVCNDAVNAVHHWPRLAQALTTVRGIAPASAAEEEHGAGAPARVPPVTSLELREAAARWPGASVDAFSDVSAKILPAEWLSITGPSGSGKTTLVSVLLAFLPLREGDYLISGADASGLAPEQLEGRLAWCPQEAHVFDSTLRANLLLARSLEEAPDEPEMRSVLEEAGLGGLLESLPQGLDTPLGPGGAHLSGGQRQRVAVARTMLTGADAIVLDEPTAHLDDETAHAMMSRLRDGMERAGRDRLAVLVTHDTRLVREEDIRIRL